MKKLFLFIFILTAVINISQAKNPLLAKDMKNSFHLSDLKYCIELNESKTISEYINKNELEKEIIKKYVEDLCFQRLYFYEQEGELDKIEPKAKQNIRTLLYNQASRLFMNELLTECEVSSETVVKKYNEEKKSYWKPEKRMVSVLYKLFPENEKEKTQIIAKLEEIRKQPDINKNFMDYVKKNSDLPGAMEGGVVNFFTKGTYGPIFEKYAFSTKEGEVSEVFQATRGAYIVKVLDVTPEGYTPIESVAEKIASTLMQDIIKQKKEAKINELKKKSFFETAKYIPDTVAGNFVFFRVNEFVMHYEDLAPTLPSIDSQIKADKSKFIELLNNYAERELLLQHYDKIAKEKPESEIAIKWNWNKIITIFPILVYTTIEKKVSVNDAELKEQYEKLKGYYHGVVPKKIGYITIPLPDKYNLSDAEYLKQKENVKRELTELREKTIKTPGKFKEFSDLIVKKYSGAKYVETGFVTETPQELNIKEEIINFNIPVPTLVYEQPDCFILAKAVETGKPAQETFEEAKDKISRVVFNKHLEEMKKNAKQEILKKYGYQFQSKVK